MVAHPVWDLGLFCGPPIATLNLTIYTKFCFRFFVSMLKLFSIEGFRAERAYIAVWADFHFFAGFS